jgi:hypothetical protein
MRHEMPLTQGPILTERGHGFFDGRNLLILDVEFADSAFQALKGLAEGISEDELRSDAMVADGMIVKAEIKISTIGSLVVSQA